jgi:hypothetical protein
MHYDFAWDDTADLRREARGCPEERSLPTERGLAVAASLNFLMPSRRSR